MRALSARYPRYLPVLEEPRLTYVVWELTLRCDQRCVHCGSRAADERPSELTTAEALDLVRQLEELGPKEVTLIGGEAYLHPGFLEVVRAIKAAGIRPSMTTGGRGLTSDLAREMAAAGLFSVSVSIDGTQATHDLIRATPGGFDSAVAALDHLRDAGLKTASNMQLNRVSQGDVEQVYEVLKAHGVTAWQLQPTASIGRAADRPELLLQPWDLLELMPRIAALKRRAFGDGILLMPGNNLGYFGPEEGLMRSAEPNGLRSLSWAAMPAARRWASSRTARSRAAPRCNPPTTRAGASASDR